MGPKGEVPGTCRDLNRAYQQPSAQPLVVWNEARISDLRGSLPKPGIIKASLELTGY